MNIDSKILEHLKELVQFGEQVIQTEKTISTLSFVDSAMAAEWSTSCISFLKQVFGPTSEYYIEFAKIITNISQPWYCKKGLGILRAAKSDYEHGYVFNLSKRIQAETFDNFLEQAEYLLGEGYIGVAIVTAGAVLEDTLRKMCEAKGIPLTDKPKLDKMNADLAKAGVYNVLIQKRVTYLASLRNNAAHGKWENLKREDAEEMIKATRRFVEDYAA